MSQEPTTIKIMKFNCQSNLLQKQVKDFTILRKSQANNTHKISYFLILIKLLNKKR